MRRGGFVLVRPVGDFAGEGIYLFRDASLRRAAVVFGGKQIELWSDNAAYGRQCVSVEWFKDHVEAKAVLSCTVLDQAFVQQALRY